MDCTWIGLLRQTRRSSTGATLPGLTAGRLIDSPIERTIAQGVGPRLGHASGAIGGSSAPQPAVRRYACVYAAWAGVKMLSEVWTAADTLAHGLRMDCAWLGPLRPQRCPSVGLLIKDWTAADTLAGRSLRAWIAHGLCMDCAWRGPLWLKRRPSVDAILRGACRWGWTAATPYWRFCV